MIYCCFEKVIIRGTKMYRLMIRVKDTQLDKVLAFLKSLPEQDVLIEKDERIMEKEENKKNIDLSGYEITAFSLIKDPVQWQREQRGEWE